MAKSRQKARKQKLQVSEATITPVSFIDRMADAALIAALFSVLVFSQLRFEAYETEKAALLPILGGIILAAHLTRFLRNRQFPQKQLLLHPMVIGLIGILISSSISSLFSFSIARSWFGEPTRMNGLQTLLIYGLLFSQAFIAYERLTRLLTPVLITISLPLCLNAMFGHFMGDIDRPGSTTGNPNFLSSWLVLALLLVLAQLFMWMRQHAGDWHWKALPILIFTPLGLPILHLILYALIYRETKGSAQKSWTKREWAYFTFVLAVATFMVITILFAGSRAALLAYIVGAVVMVCLLLGWARQIRILSVFMGLLVILAFAYLAMSQLAPDDLKDSLRFLSFSDEQRLELWNGGLNIISRLDEPFIQYDGTSDTLVGVRPLIGYGLAVIAQTQGRIGATSHGNQFVTSFHNHIFDRIAMTGYLGTITYIQFYLGALLSALRIFHFLDRNFLGWLFVSVLSSIVGVLIVPSLFEGASVLTVLPIAVSLGVIAGTIIWIILQSYRQRRDGVPNISDGHIMIAVLLGTMILRWIDIQFDFVQAASAPLCWICAGMLLGYLLKFSSAGDDEEQSPIAVNARPIDWQVCMLGAGVIVLAMFGSYIGSEIYVLEFGTDRILWLLLIIGIGGHIGLYFSLTDAHSYQSRLMLWTFGAWLIMFVSKQILISVAGSAFDTALKAGDISVATMTTPFFLLSFVAIVMILLLLLAWTFFEDGRNLVYKSVDIVSLILFALMGLSFYSVNFTASTLHAAGLVFTEQAEADQELRYFDLAAVIFEASTNIDPSNARMRLHYVDMMAKKFYLDSSSPDAAEANTQIDALFFYEPYFNNTIEWQDFEKREL